MLSRVIIAVAGAAAITCGMLYGMNEVAKTFRERDGTRYFRITDVIIPERRRPARPEEAQLPPQRAQPRAYEPQADGPRVEGPRLDVAPPLEEPRLEPQLELDRTRESRPRD